MEIKNHVIQGIKFIESPNQNERPNHPQISLIVIHSISLPPKKYNNDHIEKFFLNELDHSLDIFYKDIEGLKVSSHILIKRTGEIIQFVPFDKRAWHAGISSYKGRENCNDFSIGIELEGCDDEAFEKQQYQSLSRLINFLSIDLKINKQNIVGHADIAPGRKTDPGPFFDWTLLQSLL